MRPTYLGLGPPRTATTTIHLALTHHPDIDQAQNKELHWFNSGSWSNDLESIKQYESTWQDESKVARGEITPTYISYPDRILSLYPDIKFFIVQRDPVERLISHLKLDLVLAKKKLQLSREDFAKYKQEFIDQFQEKILAMDFSGFTVEQSHISAIKQWQNKLDETQLLILDFDELTRDSLSQKKEMNRLYKFLGARSMPTHQFKHANYFSGIQVNLDSRVIDLLSSYYQQ